MTQWSYPSPLGRGDYKEALALPYMTDEERRSLATELFASIPENAKMVALKMPAGVGIASTHYGPVRYIQAYFAPLGEPVGRLDVAFDVETSDT